MRGDLYFMAGRSIAVEKFDMRPGGVEFDFQVNSRIYREGQPMEIASTQAAQDREFMESRVKSNLFGLPLSYGNIKQMGQEGRIGLSYGLRPQIFTSRIANPPVAWRIWFRGTHYAGNPGVPRLPKGTAPARGVGSVSVHAMTKSPGQGPATGVIDR